MVTWIPFALAGSPLTDADDVPSLLMLQVFQLIEL